MIGCSFVVDREYFGEIGLLDPGMEVYGGENIELGMRVSANYRRCSLQIVPWSRLNRSGLLDGLAYLRVGLFQACEL